jgi:hypothetical protein
VKNPFGKKLVLAALSCVLLMGLVNAVLEAGSYLRDRDGCIEIGGGKIAYVPRTAQFVKVNGQVKRIVRFAATVSSAQASCQCPNCCERKCYMFVYTDSVVGGKSLLSLAIVWMDC